MNAQSRLEGFSDTDFDPFTLDVKIYGNTLNPYEKIAELRKSGNVHAGEYRTLFMPERNKALQEFNFKYFTVLGYDLVKHVLANPDLFSNKIHRHTIGRSFGRSLTTMDAPEHPIYRRIFQKAFLPDAIKHWGENVVEPIVQDLIGKFAQRGRADLIDEFTFSYPFQVIFRQLNLPLEDRATFHRLAIAQTVYPFDVEHAEEAGRKLGAYFVELLGDRREKPGDDMISALANAELSGEKLPDEVVVSFFRQLLNAGGDTTYRMTGTLLAALLQNPDQLQAVRDDRELIPQAIEEALRWDGPITDTFRLTTRDTELAGVPIPAGAVVDVVYGSANRDPAYYPNPDKFDIFRKSAHRHFGVGAGPHVCIGQHLARLEIKRALNVIFDRLPNLRLDPNMPLPEIRGFRLRTAAHLHVVFDPVSKH